MFILNLSKVDPAIKEFFRPTLGKVILSYGTFLCFFIFPAVFVCLFQHCSFLYPWWYEIMLTLLLSFPFSIIFYPFACSLVFLWKYRANKEDRGELRLKILFLVLFSLLFFNPLGIRFLILGILKLLMILSI